MKYYTVADLDITDRAWIRDYVQNVTKMVERFGGRYLARTSKMEKLEGERSLPQVFLIIEWPSKQQAAAFYESEDYGPYRESRSAGSKSHFVLVAGEDINQVARIA